MYIVVAFDLAERFRVEGHGTPCFLLKLREYSACGKAGGVSFNKERAVVEWNSESGASGYRFTEGDEGIIFRGSPGPRSRTTESVKGLSDLSKVPDKAAVEVDKSKELLDILFLFWGWPIKDSFYFLWVHF